jgi:hypothetical protein
MEAYKIQELEPQLVEYPKSKRDTYKKIISLG